MLYFALFFLIVAIALFDARRKYIPNAVTLALLLAGVLINFPGSFHVWLGSILLYTTWRIGGMGGGDAKLWMGLLWLSPPEIHEQALWVCLLVFLITGLLQIAWRAMIRTQMLKIQSPGAWRAIPFAAWLLIAVR